MQLIFDKRLRGVEAYLYQLQNLVHDLSWFDGGADTRQQLHRALNGEFSRTLRRTVDLDVLQQYGAFFTSDDMAEQLLPPLSPEPLRVLDPACGAGNLLIAYARTLPLRGALTATLHEWGTWLYGFDIAPEFVRAAKTRLILLAVERGTVVDTLTVEPDEFFPHIKAADSLTVDWPKVDLVLMNPPFTRVPVPPYYSLNTSRVTQAALFLHKACLQPAGTHIRAILPDVLRAGRNFSRLRRFVTDHTALAPPVLKGQFDADTKVDVFLLDARVGPGAPQVPAQDAAWNVGVRVSGPATGTIGERFGLSVGAVVPHRDLEQLQFPLVKYVDVSHASAWLTLDSSELTHERHFGGRVVQPPFVLVRRTSRSKDKHRAVATLVRGNVGVAVENHLLVLTPRELTPHDQHLALCEQLLTVLSDDRTTEWLNETICCRHLTVGALGSVPWWTP